MGIKLSNLNSSGKCIVGAIPFFLSVKSPTIIRPEKMYNSTPVGPLQVKLTVQ